MVGMVKHEDRDDTTGSGLLVLWELLWFNGVLKIDLETGAAFTPVILILAMGLPLHFL